MKAGWAAFIRRAEMGSLQKKKAASEFMIRYGIFFCHDFFLENFSFVLAQNPFFFGTVSSGPRTPLTSII